MSLLPLTTLAFAQSLDGSISARAGAPSAISGPDALRMTHALRARHDAILVGINTVIADNPRLTVRWVEGPNPQPVIVDSTLRAPLSCALLQSPVRPAWIVTTTHASTQAEHALVHAGARVLRVSADAQGRVDLRACFAMLRAQGVRTLMVEGGAQILQACVRQKLAQRVNITIAPIILGGLNPFAGGPSLFTQLRDASWRAAGHDLVLEGWLD